MQKLWVTLVFSSGSDRFYLNIEDMIGYKPVFFIKWCWMILTPGICAVSFTTATKSRAAVASTTANNMSCRWAPKWWRTDTFPAKTLENCMSHMQLWLILGFVHVAIGFDCFVMINEGSIVCGLTFARAIFTMTHYPYSSKERRHFFLTM